MFDFDPCLFSKMNYPELYPDAKSDIVEGLERERIIYEAEKASRDLIAHREAHKNDTPSAPVVSRAEIEEMDSEDSDAEDIAMPLYEPHILARWFEKLFQRLNSRPKVEIIEFSSSRKKLADFAPKLSPYDSGWRGLVGAKQNTNLLLQGGMLNANAAQLLEQGLNIADFRTMKYYPAQMRNIFTSYDSLKAAGFTSYHLDSCCWRLGDFAIAYSIDPIQLAKDLQLTPQRLLEVGVTPAMLRHYDTDFEETVEAGPLCDLAYKANLSVGEFTKAVHAPNTRALFASNAQDINKLTQTQALLLCYSLDGWKIDDLEQAGMDSVSIRSVGLGLRINPLKVK